MNTITIEFSENSCTKVKGFFDELGTLRNIKRKCEGNKIIYCTNKYDEYDFIRTMAQVVRDCILNVYEDYLIEKMVNDKCTSFNRLQRKRITEIALIVKNEDNDFIDRVIIARRKDVIYQELTDYFENSKHIILEGFINFRLAMYLEDLEYVVGVAEEIYEKEKEYKEFIELLRYFVEVQLPKIDVVYLTLYENGEFDIYDKFKKDVNHLYEEEMKEDLSNDKLSNEDILLGALVTMSPKKIIINNSYEGLLDSDIVRTIYKIFEHRVYVSEW